MIRPAVFLIAAIFVGLSLDSVPAASITITTIKDTTIFENNPANSAGGQTQFYSGTNTATSPRRALVQFDVAGNVPAGSTITGVKLALTLSTLAGSGGGGGGGSETIGLHEVTQAWGEGSVSTGGGQGAAAATGDATWNSRLHGSALWTSPGGDFIALASASQSIGSTIDAAYTWTTTPALVADVQTWLDTPAANFGWLLLNIDEATAQTFRAFYSRESGTTNFRPALEITYVPEPSSMVLLALGGVAALAHSRRRRVAS